MIGVLGGCLEFLESDSNVLEVQGCLEFGGLVSVQNGVRGAVGD